MTKTFKYSSKVVKLRGISVTVTETDSFFKGKFFQITSFILGPILISAGIFVLGTVWKIILITSGIGLLFGLYFSRKSFTKMSNDICDVCTGTGSVRLQSSMMSEHTVKNCLSYRATTKTCGMCEGTGLKSKDDSEK